MQLLFALFSILLLSFPPVQAQAQPSTRDPRAIAALTQCLATAGGTQAIALIRDFKASGTISYFWGGAQVSGQATVRARNTDQFRLDAQLSHGLRSLVVNRGRNEQRGVTGTGSEISHFNAASLGILTFPYPAIAAALGDPLAQITYVGVAEVSGRQAHQVHVRRRLLNSQDPMGSHASLMTMDYFVDAQTGVVIRVADATHPVATSSTDFRDVIDFADHANVGGVIVPMLVSERHLGKMVWELRLQAMTFNVGVKDSDFNLD